MHHFFLFSFGVWRYFAVIPYLLGPMFATRQQPKENEKMSSAELPVGDELLPLPPLPEPIPPAVIQGQRLEDIYQVIRSLRREVDDVASHEGILELLTEDLSTLKAVATVLHQSGALLQYDATSGAVEALPVPPCPAPQLLPGYTSWIAPANASMIPTEELPSYAFATSLAPVGTAW